MGWFRDGFVGRVYIKQPVAGCITGMMSRLLCSNVRSIALRFRDRPHSRITYLASVPCSSTLLLVKEGRLIFARCTIAFFECCSRSPRYVKACSSSISSISSSKQKNANAAVATCAVFFSLLETVVYIVKMKPFKTDTRKA